MFPIITVMSKSLYTTANLLHPYPDLPTRLSSEVMISVVTTFLSPIPSLLCPTRCTTELLSLKSTDSTEVSSIISVWTSTLVSILLMLKVTVLTTVTVSVMFQTSSLLLKVTTSQVTPAMDLIILTPDMVLTVMLIFLAFLDRA